MINHENLKEKLTAFRDAELAEEDRKTVAQHLQGCTECQGLLKRWDLIASRLSQTPLPESSERFVTGVMDRLEALENPEPAVSRSFLPKWVFPTLGYSFAFFLMVVAISYREASVHADVNAESVLLADVPQTVQWAFSTEDTSVDTLFATKEEV